MFEVHPRIAWQLAFFDGKFRIVEHSSLGMPIRTPCDFAKALEYNPRRIAKTLLLANSSIRSKKRDDIPLSNYAVVCLPAPDRVDLEKLADSLRWPRAEFASGDELNRLLHYPPNGVSPLGIFGIQLFIDKTLMAFETIMIGSGAPAIEIEIEPRCLLALTHGRLCDFVKCENAATQK